MSETEVVAAMAAAMQAAEEHQRQGTGQVVVPAGTTGGPLAPGRENGRSDT